MIVTSAGNVGIGTASPVGGLSVMNGNVGIGTWSPAASLDIGSKTDGIRVPNGTTAQQPSCASSIAGTVRYNSQTTFMEFCDGSSWNAMPKLQSATPPSTPSGSGYIVLTATTWNGNLGGLNGANAKCLTELSSTYTDWAGYSDANSRGLLTGAHVNALLCDNSSCNYAIPNATYYFATAGSSGTGGATFTATAAGLGPDDSATWSAANRFGVVNTHWTGMQNANGNTLWGTSNPSFTCDSWTSAGVGSIGRIGTTSGSDVSRWYTGATPGCDSFYHLICLVNP